MNKLPLSALAISAAAVFALLLSGSTASATILTGAGGVTLGTGTTISAENEGTVTLHPSIGDIECSSSKISGKTTNSGGTGESVNGNIESLSFSSCNSTVTVLTKGNFTLNGTSGSNGTIGGTGSELTIEFAGFHCIFKTSSTLLGTVTGSGTTGSNATIDTESTLPRTGGRSGAFCGSTAQWTGAYKLTSPSTLNINGSSSGGYTTYISDEGFGASNPSQEDIHRCFKVDPINCATGNLVETQVDLTVVGHGPPMQVTRYYNSQLAASQGSFGYGWTGSYSASLTFNAEKTQAVVRHDNGSTIDFTLVSGQYFPPAWSQASLVKSGENYIYTQPDYTKLEFSGSGRLLKITDRHNLYLTLTYNAGGRLETVANQASRKLTFAYNASGQVEKITDPLGRVVKYAYSAGNLASVTLPGVETPRWKFGYNGSHDMTTLTNGRGKVTTTEYDGSHRATSQSDPLGRKTSFVYQEVAGVDETTITEPNGAKTIEKFNEAGEPTSIIHAVGTSLEAKSVYVYDNAFRLISATDPLGHTTTNTYDSRGNKLTEKDGNGTETKWTYNSSNDIATITNPKGQATTFTRNATGDPTVVKRTIGASTQETKFVYNEWGDLTQRTDPAGRSRFYLYFESNGLPLIESSSSTFATESILKLWRYNLDGELTEEVDGRGYEAGNEQNQFTTKITRDAQGRPITKTDPLGNTTKVAYDLDGNVESVTDGNGHVTSYVYDVSDQRIEAKAANGSITKTGYDLMGKVSSRTDGKGNVTEYKHDLLERVTEAIDPLGRKTTYEYDLAGNLVKEIDAEGRSTTYSYDAGNRATKVDYSDPATADVSFTYDKDGNVVEMTDGTGTTKRSYDALDRLTEVVNGKGESVKYEYNLANDITKMTYPNGQSITRGFDSLGRLEKVVDWFGAETKFSYYRNSQLKATTFPTATSNVDEYSYNPRGDVTQIAMKKGAEVLASLSYTRDKSGQIEKIIQKGFPGSPEEIAYGYDAANRLLKSNGTLFEYDAANGLTKNGSDTYTYDKAGQIATASNGTYVYNKLGQRTKSTPTSGPSTTYSYDEAGRLTSVQRPAEGETTEINSTFKYDGTGLRTTETNGASSYPMVWDTTSKLPLLLRKGNDYYIYGPEGLPIEQITSSLTLFLHHDQQGSTRILTGSTGEVVGTYEYGPYGAVWKHTGAQSTQMGFGGEYRMHTASQLIYLRARTYDPATGQFLSVDPLLQESGEPYSYAEDNPVSGSDPTGLTTEGLCVQVSGSIPLVEGSASFCAVSDGKGQTAWTFSIGGGALTSDALGRIDEWVNNFQNVNFLKGLWRGAQISGMLAWERTDANDVSDLGGSSVYINFGGGAFGLGLSYERSFSASTGVTGRRYGFGLASPGWGSTSGMSYTWVFGKQSGRSEALPGEPTFHEVQC